MNAIELHGITKHYGANRVFSGLDLTIPAGGFHVLVGRNGSGKSTLLRILMRHENYRDGAARVLGVDLERDHASLRHHVGYVSESIEFETGTRLNRFFRHFGGLYDGWDARVFGSLIERLGIPLSRRFSEYSRGQKMQIAFAAAIAAHPRLLLIDEITSVLDARSRSIIVAELAAFARRGGTVILATNVVSEVHHVADHLVLIENGGIRLKMDLDKTGEAFHKVRLRNGDEAAAHEIFSDPMLVDIGVNSDGSVSYILPAERAARYGIPAELEDRRAVTAEEAFIYFTKRTED